MRPPLTPPSPSPPSGDAPVGGRDPLRPARIAWVMLDWAASAFSTISITLLVAYVEKFAFAAAPWGVEGGVVWAWTLAVAMLATALLAPWATAWADRVRGHRQALVASIVMGCAGAFLLAALPTEARGGIVSGVLLGAVGFDLAAIFTGSLLPRVAQGSAADRLSAAGYAAGYAGGALALLLALQIFTFRARLGLDDAGALRGAFAIMGAWWFLFSVPAFLVDFGPAGDGGHSATSAGELASFARSLLRGDGAGKRLGGILAGATLVLGAMQTAIAQFTTVALEEFHLQPSQLVWLVLLVQAVALPGALAVGWLSGRIGRGRALGLSLAGWTAVFVLGWFVDTTGQLWALAVLLALVLGGAASVIRAAVAGIAPPGRSGTTFGLLNVGAKLAGASATIAFGAIYQATGHPRSGLVALLVQLAVGWWLLVRAGGDALDGSDDGEAGASP